MFTLTSAFVFLVLHCKPCVFLHSSCHYLSFLLSVAFLILHTQAYICTALRPTAPASPLCICFGLCVRVCPLLPYERETNSAQTGVQLFPDWRSNERSQLQPEHWATFNLASWKLFGLFVFFKEVKRDDKNLSALLLFPHSPQLVVADGCFPPTLALLLAFSFLFFLPHLNNQVLSHRGLLNWLDCF